MKRLLSLIVVVMVGISQVVADTRLPSSPEPFESLSEQAKQGILILTTCSAVYALYAQAAAGDALTREQALETAENLRNMAQNTVGADQAQAMIEHSMGRLIAQALKEPRPGQTLNTGASDCQAIIKATFVDFFTR
jgi:hypothetical protein